MPGKIQRLPLHIAQTIAAGEVVERPASVVKELVENSIDAGSTEIIIDLKGGGIQLIRVRDNGEGIDEEDLPLALERYATSKIRCAEDLFSVQTLGFRGEALPSIASVSLLTIVTRTSQSPTGIRGVWEGGSLKNLSEAGCPVGTEVEVRNLFYNVPVKRKFLKSIRSELHHIVQQVLRLAMAYPTISFALFHDGRRIHELFRSDSLSLRVESVLGKEVFGGLCQLEWEERGIRISGYTSLPSFSRRTLDGIYLYVNGRFVRDRLVNRAIVDAYRSVLPEGRFPLAVLFITVAPYAVDVNVHPSKAEVRFRDPESVFHAVRESVISVLGLSGTAKLAASEATDDRLIKHRIPSDYMLSAGERGGPSFVAEPDRSETREESRCSIRVIGQAYGTYLICETDGGLLLIDQHAAHERVVYEKLKRQIETNSVPTIQLLLPVLIETSPEESFLLDNFSDVFASVGFEIDPAGERTYAVRSHPWGIERDDVAGIVHETLRNIDQINCEGKRATLLENILRSLACNTAIKGNRGLKREEIEELLDKVAPYPKSATCPHGRPIFFFLEMRQLERLFGRSS